MPDAAPATIATPAAAPPAPAADVPSSPSSTAKSPPKGTAIAPQKVFIPTKVPPRAFSSQVAAAAASQGAPPPAAAPEVPAAEPAAEATETDGVSPAEASEVGNSAADSTEGTPPAKPGAVAQGAVPEAEGAAAEKPAVDASELTARLAKLNRKEAKMQSQLGVHAELAALVGPQHATRETVKHLVGRVQMLEQGKQAALADPAGFIERLYGIPRAHIVEKTINGIIGESAKTPEQKAKEAADAEFEARKARLDAYEKQLQEAAQKQNVQATESQVRAYIDNTIAPLVASDDYKFLRAERGARAAQDIHEIQTVKFRQTGKAPQPKEVADFLEKKYREKAAKAAALLGASVTPKKPASPSGTEPPPAKRPAPPTRAPQPNPAIRRGAPKPYTVRVVG